MRFWMFILTLVYSVASAKDFTWKDVVKIYPADPPFEGAVRCFTCTGSRDNYNCNRYAPDRFCPEGHFYCLTEHHFIEDDLIYKETISVTKKCAKPHECFQSGCKKHRNSMKCTSCCEGEACNIAIPKNATSAVFQYVAPLRSSATSRINYFSISTIFCAQLYFLFNNFMLHHL